LSAPTYADALAVARDLLESLGGTDGRRLLETLLTGHKVVGPLVTVNRTYAIRMGLGAGRVAGARLDGVMWHWELDTDAYGNWPLPQQWPTGVATTLEEADVAMVAALHEIGWLCLGAV
jgi:hypothetical protein